MSAVDSPQNINKYLWNKKITQNTVFNINDCHFHHKHKINNFTLCCQFTSTLMVTQGNSVY